MNVISLDAIVKNILLKRGYYLHHYLHFLVSAKDGLREIAFDEKILTIRYKVLVPDSNNKCELPNDFKDYVRVSARVNQYLQPLVEDNALDFVPNYNSTFDVSPYIDGVASDTTTDQQYLLAGYQSPYWWLGNWSMWGENLGRQFGGVGAYADTFRIDREQNLLILNENLSLQDVVLEYIGDGMDADSATHIDSYAQFAIEAFAIWQHYLHNRTYSQNEAELMRIGYEKERQILRARLSDITLEKLKRIVQRNQIGVKY